MKSEKKTAFERFVRSERFPCVGAKAALAQGSVEMFEADAIDRPASDLPLYRALSDFAGRLDPEAAFAQSFVAIYSGPPDLTEREFETALWDRLQGLHNIDAAAGHEWTEES
ncbi:MAG: YqcI/YcgG family protein, partial [Rhodospirillaceae bacterium]